MEMKKLLYLLPLSMLIVWGCEKNNQPEPEPTPTMSTVNIVDGAIEAPFSVGNGKVVYFSRGNLQYNAATSTWRFAEAQYDALKEENKKRTPTYNGWIDMFGWGTSGYNGCMPYLMSDNYRDYPGGSDIAGTNYDWGQYNAISNGGNEQGVWRTLTRNEWDYLLGRYDEDVRPLDYIVEVHGNEGLMLLPDNFIREAVGYYSWYAGQKISDSDWNKLQQYGAVFLPECGHMFHSSTGDSLIYSKYLDGYWTSSACRNSVFSWHVIFQNTYASVADNYFDVGDALPVRLVKDKQ